MYLINTEQPVHIHFIGIGGISMSAIAELLHRKGFHVTGSDERESTITKHLSSLGIGIQYGNRASNITGKEAAVVHTAAIHENNPELQAVRKLQIPCLTRAELLGQIMLDYPEAVSVAGTHGKTTTTSMLALIEMEAKFNPTVLVGGELPEIQGTLRMGDTAHMVMEADEYTNSFLHFNPRHAVILNIEADHPDFFKDVDEIRTSFHAFAKLLPPDGHLVINRAIRDWEALTADLPCTVIPCGLSDLEQSSSSDDSVCPYTAENITFSELGAGSFDLYHYGKLQTRITLSVSGIHNVSNALCAISMAHSLGISFDCCARALEKYHGTKRRFEYKGNLQGVLIFDDYAHHPSEIRAALQSARTYGTHRVVCVFQPHTYSRTRRFLKEFAEALSMADLIILPDIYPAREENPGDISSQDIKLLLSEKGKDVYYFPSFDEIESFLLENCRSGDLLITMGAGDVVNIGDFLLGK